MGLQGAAQLALMFCVPLYFQVTERSSNTIAGAHLTPAVAGNALGAILTGALIKRYAAIFFYFFLVSFYLPQKLFLW